MVDEVSFAVEPVNLREILNELKQVDPKLANALRREWRRAGDEILAAQRAALAKRPPRVGGSTKVLRLIRPRGNRRKPYLAFRRIYKEGDTRTGGVSNLRSKIAAGLRVRTIASTRRQAIEFKTTGPRNGDANMARVYESPMFRHPVFGGDDKTKWVPQYGQPYFFRPITDDMRDRMAARIYRSIDDAFASFTGKTTTT